MMNTFTRSSFFLSLFLAPFLLFADIHRGDFILQKFDGTYLIPIQNQMVYPDFQKQISRTYIPLKECKYRRVKVDHDLTLRARDKGTIKALEKEISQALEKDFQDASWDPGKLPFVVNKYPDRYMDGVYYRVRIFIPEEYRKNILKLFFLAANYFTDVWVNGQWAGCHEGGYTSFAFDISRFVNFNKENLIFIRLDNVPWITDDNPEANEHTIVPYKQMDWWNYTGINRDVYIEVSEKVSVVRADIPYEFTEGDLCLLSPYLVLNNGYNEEKRLTYSINIYQARVDRENILSLYAKDLCDTTGVIHRSGETEVRIKAHSFEAVKAVPVKLRMSSSEGLLEETLSWWSASSPNLYVMEIMIKDKDRVIDKSYFQFGVRRFRIEDQKIRMNDEKSFLFLKGTAYHEEFYPNGRAIDESGLKVILDNFKLARDLNCNFLRTTHYPHHFFTYLLADRMGFWIWEEIPVMWFDGPEMVFQVRNKKLPQQMLLEMMYMNYNSPSILFHGFANECGWQDERSEYLWEMKKLARKIMKNRIYGQSAAGSDMTDNTHKDMDILGATMYYGVFYWDDPYSHTLLALKKMHAYFPDKPILDTEFGYWSGDTQNDQEKQVWIARQTFKAFTESKLLTGMVWWTLLDWYTILTGTQTMGLVSMDRSLVKPAFFEIQRLYGEKLKGYCVSFINLTNNQKIKGTVLAEVSVSPREHVQSVQYSMGDLDFTPLASSGDTYQVRLDTSKMKEGKVMLLVRVELDDHEVLYDRINLVINNYDEPPVFQVNLQQEKVLMKDFDLKIHAWDDSAVVLVQYRIDEKEPVSLKGENDYYRSRLDLEGFKDGSRHEIMITVKDDGKHIIRTNIPFVYNNSPGISIDLPYDLDRIAFSNNKKDCYYWGFPGEELPDSRTWIVCDGCNAKFLFPDKQDKANNIMVSLGNYIKVKPDHYSVLNVWGYSYWGNVNNDLLVYYEDGTSEKLDLRLSEWTMPDPQFQDHRAYYCAQHYESSGKSGMPSTSFYHCRFKIDKGKKLMAVEFPNDSHKHIIAAGLEK